MNEDDEQGTGGVGLGRTLALSDGVFAIAMTLLAFQIQPPDLQGYAVHHLAAALGHLGSRFFVYGLSFMVIGILWLAHHRLFNHLVRADEPLMFLNLLFLMIVAGLPFPSSLLGRYGTEATAVVVYALSMAVAGSLLTGLLLLARRRRLLSAATTPEGMRIGILNSASMVAVFALSVPVAVASPTAAQFSWLLILPLRVVVTRVTSSRS